MLFISSATEVTAFCGVISCRHVLGMRLAGNQVRDLEEQAVRNASTRFGSCFSTARRTPWNISPALFLLGAYGMWKTPVRENP
jgi:hypothetical protein